MYNNKWGTLTRSVLNDSVINEICFPVCVIHLKHFKKNDNKRNVLETSLAQTERNGKTSAENLPETTSAAIYGKLEKYLIQLFTGHAHFLCKTSNRTELCLPNNRGHFHVSN